MTVVEFITALGMTGAGQDDMLIVDTEGGPTIKSVDFEINDEGHRTLLLTLGKAEWPEPVNDEEADDEEANDN